MADTHFEEARLARLYDPLDPDRGDLAVYVAMVDEFAARNVLDVGCGTGTFACLLARRGIQVVGVDPAAASLGVARGKPGADAVTWIHGDATGLPPLHVDLATMTANVAQVFVTDAAWAATLSGVRAALKPGGRVVFETRDPAVEAWRGWTSELTRSTASIQGVGAVEAWVEVTDVSGDLVTFRGTYVWEADGAVLTSDSTLRFRTRDEVADGLVSGGYTVDEVRDAPDRPGKEFVFVSRRDD